MPDSNGPVTTARRFSDIHLPSKTCLKCLQRLYIYMFSKCFWYFKSSLLDTSLWDTFLEVAAVANEREERKHPGKPEALYHCRICLPVMTEKKMRPKDSPQNEGKAPWNAAKRRIDSEQSVMYKFVPSLCCTPETNNTVCQLHSGEELRKGCGQPRRGRPDTAAHRYTRWYNVSLSLSLLKQTTFGDYCCFSNLFLSFLPNNAL